MDAFGSRTQVVEGTGSTGDGNMLLGFSSEHWQALLAAFGKPYSKIERVSGKFSVYSWVIDTRASNHVTGNFSCLNNVNEIASCMVGLPDGQKVQATKMGLVQLFDKIHVSHVLFVPKIKL
ncbi:unnamed protein product [Cuscuta epithymum]|uniref:Retrovirus-related Pol polyprotein from transposon TNT 1-94-like beta-barrel domain-containing protein n=1 Tax=Cuscuta epithymum TaxID=186058 RepID=A0AAV0CXC8_9ASTE|nr:unnamed protein product [Cuscuta epithymum]